MPKNKSSNLNLDLLPQGSISTFDMPTLGTESYGKDTSFLNKPGAGVNTGFNAGIDPNAPISPIPGFTSMPNIPGAEAPGFFDAAGGSRFIVPGIEALSGLGGLYLAKQQLDLGQDQFNFVKDANTRDFASQAQAYNTNLQQNQRSVLSAKGTYDTSTPEGQAEFDAALEDYVNQHKINV